MTFPSYNSHLDHVNKYMTVQFGVCGCGLEKDATNLLSDVVERISIHSPAHQTLEQDYEYRYPEGWNEVVNSLTK